MSKSKKLKPIPTFRNEEEEFEFWSNHDFTDYLDLSKAKQVTFPNLKPSTERISLRLPKDVLEKIKVMANKRDMPYQSLIKHILYHASYPNG